ncbi:MAG TPA: hypothetical protein VIU38_14880 [Anaerolineales bacterium]
MLLSIVFSKNRALQLDACLASLYRHGFDASTMSITVLYKVTSPRFQRQYEELARAYEGKARFVPELSFRQQVIGLLGSEIAPRFEKKPESAASRFLGKVSRRPAQYSPGDCVVFLVDDTIFVRAVTFGEAQTALSHNQDALGFSLRLGTNTSHTYVLERRQSLPRFRDAGGGLLKYEWVGADADFGYPFELSSSVYRLRTILNLVTGISFGNPNALESEMSLRARKYAGRQPAMLCLEKSVAFSTPLNRVQDVFNNRTGSESGFSVEALADRFDADQRIDVAALDGFVPTSCHQEVALTFAGGHKSNAAV